MNIPRPVESFFNNLFLELKTDLGLEKATLAAASALPDDQRQSVLSYLSSIAEGKTKDAALKARWKVWEHRFGLRVGGDLKSFADEIVRALRGSH
jgi:hypothetical protein